MLLLPQRPSLEPEGKDMASLNRPSAKINRRNIAIWSLALLIVAGKAYGAGTKVEGNQTAKREIETLLKYRESLASGVVTIHSARFYRGGTEKFEEKLGFVFAEGGRRIRYECERTGRNVKYARNAMDSLVFVHGSGQVMKDVPEKEYDVADVMPFDIRGVGLHTWHGIANRVPFEKLADMVRGQTVTIWEVESDERHRIEWVLNRKTVTQARKKVWINPKQGNAVTRLETWREDISGDKIVGRTLYDEQHTESQQVNGVWVPVKMVAREHSNQMGFDWRLDWTMVNQPVADVEFQLDGLKLPAGTVVFNYRSGEPVRESVIGKKPRARKAQPDDAPLAQRLAQATRNARLCEMQALVVLQGDTSQKVTDFVEAIALDTQPSIRAYVLLFVDDERIKSDTTTLKKLGWQLPQLGEVVLIALDGAAKQLGTERLFVADFNAATKLTTSLLNKHAPPVCDAQVRLVAAQEEAKRTGRKLWIIEGGPRCGPCFRLARWLEDQHALLEKDYVILKVMTGLDLHAEGVIKQLDRPQQGGIPWYAITESDCKVLTTSDSSLGNIGMPSSVESIGHLREMLKQTASRLTAEDLDHLAESLADFK